MFSSPTGRFVSFAQLALQICATTTVVAGRGVEPGVAAQQAVTGRVVLAAVVDRRNRPLVDVGVDDVVITESGQPREVLDVHIADYPVVVLLDDAADTAELMEPMKSAVSRFVSRIGERPVAIGTLSTPDMFVASFDDDRADVLKRIDTIAPSGASSTTPLAPVAAAAARLREAGVPFSAVVVVTAHPITPSAQVSADVVASILESGASVQVIIVRRAGDPPDAGRGDLLRVIGEQTHGQYTPIFSAASFPIALDRIADRMAAELMIEYVVPAGSTGGDVKVGARIPGARVVGLGVK